MITTTDFQKFFRPFVDSKEEERATYMLPIIYDTVSQEAINRGIDLDKMIADGKLKQSVLDNEVAGVLAAFLVQPTDIASSEAADGYNIVYAPTVRVVDRVLARLGIRKQVMKRV